MSTPAPAAATPDGPGGTRRGGTAAARSSRPDPERQTAMALRCQFHPYGRQCANTAAAEVTLSGRGLPPETVPTCSRCLPDSNDDVQATARPITGNLR